MRCVVHSPNWACDKNPNRDAIFVEHQFGLGDMKRNCMDSKLREPAMMVAGWGLLYGDFFDLYDVAAAFDIPKAQAVQLMNYLRTSDWVDKTVKVRRGLREDEKAPPDPKWEPIQQQLTRLVKLMPSPRGAR
jgi:hypothetical protein